jgi:hypothetical protein
MSKDRSRAVSSKAGPACVCGYDGSSWADVDQHILASMNSDEDHARAR